MSAQDPGLDILEALLKGRQPPSPPPPPEATTEDVAMGESQERFVGALRPEARTYTGRPELCWSFWLKGRALTEDAPPQQPYLVQNGTVTGIPEETIKTHMRDAFRRYLVYAIRTAGYFPAMVQRVDEWTNNPESQVQDLEGMTNSEMLKISLKHDSVTLDPQMASGASATKVSIRWGGTRELYHWDTPTNDSNTVWLFLPMIEMFNRMINDSTNSSPNNRDPIQAMQSVNEAMFGFEVGSLRVTSHNFPLVVGERPFQPDGRIVDIASIGGDPVVPESDYDAWYSAMEPTMIDPNVYGRIITINELEDYYGWKESSAERYIQWSMICKNMSTHALRMTNLESAPVGALVAPTGVYVTLRGHLKNYLRRLQSATFRLTQPQLAAETVSQLATTIVDHWGSSENLEIRVEKALLKLQDDGVVGEKPVMRICVRWRLPKNVAIDMMHDLRHHVDGRPRNPQWMETHVCANVAKLTSCRIPEAEFPNYSNEHRRRWKPRITDVPFRRSEFDAWSESYFLD